MVKLILEDADVKVRGTIHLTIKETDIGQIHEEIHKYLDEQSKQGASK